MGCLKLERNTLLRIAHTSNSERSGEDKYCAGTYKYKYQGQERQDELGLNWDSFKWRNYDYAIGRFMSVDPLSEKYSYQSVYNFSENRVIDGRELEGLEWENIKNNDGTTTRQLTVQMVNNSSISDKQVDKLILTLQKDFAENFKGEGGIGKLNVEKVNSSDCKCDFLVSLTDVRSNKIFDMETHEVVGEAYEGGKTSKLGETQKNSFDLTVSVNDSKIGNSGISRSFSHEAGHTVGLEHPWISTNPVIDIRQNTEGVSDKTVRNNLMNSDQNKINPSVDGKNLTKGQFQSMEALIKKQTTK